MRRAQRRRRATGAGLTVCVALDALGIVVMVGRDWAVGAALAGFGLGLSVCALGAWVAAWPPVPSTGCPAPGPGPRLWVVTHRGPDGVAGHATNVTAVLGDPEYDRICATLRRGLPAEWTLDTVDADAQHQGLLTAKVAYRAAELEWMAGGRDHPGSLADYMP